jgi:hypothetical protein
MLPWEAMPANAPAANADRAITVAAATANAATGASVAIGANAANAGNGKAKKKIPPNKNPGNIKRKEAVQKNLNSLSCICCRLPGGAKQQVQDEADFSTPLRFARNDEAMDIWRFGDVAAAPVHYHIITSSHYKGQR